MVGSVLALACAIAWSLSVVLIKKSGATIHPLALNLAKNLLGLFLLLVSVFIFEGRLYWPDLSTTMWLMLSGFVGIGVADGLVLRAMQCLKASDIAVLECLFAPFVIILAILFTAERPKPIMLLGGLCILGSVYFVAPKTLDTTAEDPAIRRKGIILMATGLFMVATGIVMVKPLFDEVPLLSLVTIRMLAGVFGSLVIFSGTKDMRSRAQEFLSTPHKKSLFWGCFLSAYLSIILWIAGYKYLPATEAALLNQTSTIFTVIFAMIFLGEKLNRDKLMAISLALIGVAMITFA